MSKSKKYPNGGLIKNTGDFLSNYGKGVADSALGIIGLNNVIPDSAYNGTGSNFFNKSATLTGNLGKSMLPLAGQMVGLPAPITAGAISTISQFNPENKYSMGGSVKGLPELEKKENTLNPDGTTEQVNGPSHKQGGVKINLDPGTLVFSDRLKLGKKTFAELNKPYNTKKEEKILNDSKSNSQAKLTAQLMMAAKNKQSLDLYSKQENLKQNKLNNYAKRIGLNSDNKFTYGGETDGKIDEPYKVLGNSADSNAKVRKIPFMSNDPLGSNPSTEFLTGNPNYGISGTPIVTNSGTSMPENWSPTATNTTNLKTPNNFNLSNSQKNALLQGGLGLAANAGNIYDLYRSQNKFLEKSSLERYNPTFLDYGQAITDNNNASKQAINNVRDASVGNSATYLNNRRALLADRINTNQRIRMQYQNANAEIANQAGMYNNQLANQEKINDMQIKANARNIKSNAISNIGHNIYSQGANAIRDEKMQNSELEYLKYLSLLYPQGLPK